jgi:hypothetical protein
LAILVGGREDANARDKRWHDDSSGNLTPEKSNEF